MNLDNLDEFLRIQINGIYKHYETLLSLRNTQMTEKIKLLIEINEKIETSEIEKSKKEIEADRSEINKIKT